MSQIAELAVLQRQVKDLEDSIKTIERGLSKKELKLRDEFAMHAPQPQEAMPLEEHCAYRYRYADAMIKARGEK